MDDDTLTLAAAARKANSVAVATDPLLNSIGLSSAEVVHRRVEFGANELPKNQTISMPRRVVRQLRSPLTALLAVAGFLTIFVLDRRAEGCSILAIVLLNVAIAVQQERTADDALVALERLCAPSCKVWRDGVLQILPTTELVVGDLVDLDSGDRVPADGRIVGQGSVQLDESMLTGESLPVRKIAGGEVFSGTHVVSGYGRAIVSAVGASTKFGEIATALETQTDPPLVRELSDIAKQVSGLALFIGGAVGAITYQRAAGTSGRFTESLLTGVALAIAAIPEGLSTVIISALAIGSRRMAKRGVIVRDLPAVQALGSVSVLCADKTGTITTGRVEVVDTYSVTGREDELWLAVSRANDSVDGVGDPLDVALWAAADSRAVDVSTIGTRVQAIPFSPETRMMSTLHRAGDQFFLSVKGAPEEVLRLCARNPQDPDFITRIEELADRGLRVIAVAGTVSDHPIDLNLKAPELQLFGVIALGDTVRATAADAVADCRRAGIRVVMVTGDHVRTATAIAKEVGILHGSVTDDDIVDGNRLAKMNQAEADDALRRASVVARVQPAAKTQLVEAHRSVGNVVCMTGDGVNDAPALRRAEVGVAIAGATGTDVARHAASVVVTDDDLGTIVLGVAEGRRISRNLANVIQFLLTGNLTEVLVVIGALIVLPKLAVPLLPVQLLWINLITDGLPALALGTDGQAGDSLEDGPRSKNARFLGLSEVVRMGYEALIIAVIVLSVTHVAANRWNWNPPRVRSFLLLTLIICHLVYAYVARARRFTFESGWWRSRFVFVAIIGSLLLQGVAFGIGIGRHLLGVTSLPTIAWLVTAFAPVIMIGLIDATRLFRKRQHESTPS